MWPSGTGRPGTANLNFQTGRNIATTVITPLGPDGSVQIFNGSGGAVDLIVDVQAAPGTSATTGNTPPTPTSTHPSGRHRTR